MQSKVLVKFFSGNFNLVAVGFELSKIIAEYGKPFSDGDCFIESWLECARFLFDSFPGKEELFNALRIFQRVETREETEY
jgi:hypothetical protein